MFNRSLRRLKSHFLRRLRHNYNLSIITLMGVFGVLSITPYAVYRIVSSDFAVAFADSIAVISIIIAVIYAWRTNDTTKPGLYLSVTFSIAATIATINLGINGFFWIYPLILFNFFVVSPARALGVMLAVLSSIVSYHIFYPNTVFASHYQMTSFLVTCMLASILSFIFAYRSKHQRERLEKLASRDPLTSAYNRRAMTAELRKAVYGNRSACSYGLLVMDLDHFKTINDAFGHATGDQVLIDFVRIIQANIRETDRLFRHGGEEFALLLPNTDLLGLRIVANMLLKQVSNKLSSPAGAVSTSIGGAILVGNEGWQDWLNRADEQLYRAKGAGRNCCYIAGQDTARNAN